MATEQIESIIDIDPCLCNQTCSFPKKKVDLFSHIFRPLVENIHQAQTPCPAVESGLVDWSPNPGCDEGETTRF